MLPLIPIAIGLGAALFLVKKPTGTGAGPGTKTPYRNKKISDMINRILTSDDTAGWKQWRADWGAHFGDFPNAISDDFKILIFANAVTSTAQTGQPISVIGKWQDYIYKTTDLKKSGGSNAKPANAITTDEISAAAKLIAEIGLMFA